MVSQYISTLELKTFTNRVSIVCEPWLQAAGVMLSCPDRLPNEEVSSNHLHARDPSAKFAISTQNSPSIVTDIEANRIRLGNEELS